MIRREMEERGLREGCDRKMVLCGRGTRESLLGRRAVAATAGGYQLERRRCECTGSEITHRMTHLLPSSALYHLPEIFAAGAAAHAPVMLFEKDRAFFV